MKQTEACHNCGNRIEFTNDPDCPFLLCASGEVVGKWNSCDEWTRERCGNCSELHRDDCGVRYCDNWESRNFSSYRRDEWWCEDWKAGPNS